MSDRVVQSCHDGDGRTGQSINSYQSVWMAHWTRTNCDTTPQVHNHSSLHLDNKKNDYVAEQHLILRGEQFASDISTSAKGFREVTEARTVKITNENLTTRSHNLINERLDCQPFRIFDLCQNNHSSSASKADQGASCHRLSFRPENSNDLQYNTIALDTRVSRFPSVLAVAAPAAEDSLRAYHFQSVDISQNPEYLADPHKFLRGSNLSAAEASLDKFTGSTPVPSVFNRGAPGSSFMCGQELNELSSVLPSKEHFSDTNFTILEHEHHKYHSHSGYLVYEEKIDNHLNSGKSGTEFLRQNSASLPLSSLAEEHDQKIQNCSGNKILTVHSSTADASKSERLYRRCYSLQRMPQSIDDVEATTVCKTVDSVDGLLGGAPKLSQTTHSLFISKTDVDLDKENQMLRESRLSAKFNGKMFTELLSLSPNLGHGPGGVKVQSLASTDNKEKDNAEDAKTSEIGLKNESSTETDTMDMDAFRDTNLSGVDSFPSNNDLKEGQNPPSQATIDSTREEVGCRWHLNRLPDINEEPPTLPDTASSMDKEEPSTSRTQSLDVEHILSHADQLTNLKSSSAPDDLLIQGPSSRWVKRLKPSASDSSTLGTKSSNLGEGLPHKKADKLFSRNTEGIINNSELMTGKRCGKEPMILDQDAILLKNGKSSSLDSTKKGLDITLSHRWIRRWCQKQAAAPQKKPETLVVCDPQCSKMPLDELQKQQFPSIAAMALLGKTMSAFQSCDFQKSGSFMVWNTKV